MDYATLWENLQNKNFLQKLYPKRTRGDLVVKTVMPL